MASIDLTLRLHHETPQAILVSDDGEEKHAVWLPKSQIEWQETKPGYVEAVVPEWLAADKRLI